MAEFRIIVAAPPRQQSQAEDIRRRLESAWPSRRLPQFAVLETAGLDACDLTACDAVVLVAERSAGQGAVLSLLGMLEEANVPVLALLDGAPEPGNPYEFAGALARDRDGDEAMHAAALHGLAHRQREIRRLRSEVRLATRHHGGLKDQVTRMQEDLQLAAMVQREFLPRQLPSLHGVSFEALWRPAHFVSGDLYDVIRLDEDHMGLFVADSIGHGVPAALMTMVICRALTVKEVDDHAYRILPPAEVLDRLNRHLIRRRGRTTRFATAVYAVINCRTRRITVAGAGHPPAIVLRGDGPTELVETSGGLLGVFDDEHYEQRALQLHERDRLILYSDGFEQAFPQDGAGGASRRPTSRYRQEFEAFRRCRGPGRMIEHISRRLDDQAGSLNQVDDLTLVGLTVGAIRDQPAGPALAGHRSPL